jgi:hypothetical protein
MAYYFSGVDPAYVFKRKGDTADPFIFLKETFQVLNGIVTLREIPDFNSKVTVRKLDGTLLTETTNTPIANQYRVDYTSGIISFHSSHEGNTLTFDYYGIGYVSFPSSRIWVDTNASVSGKSLQQVITDLDNSKTKWLSAVNTFADINTSYPSPKLGDTVQTISDSKIYRYDGNAWLLTQQYSANALTNIQNSIGTITALQTTQKGNIVDAINENVSSLNGKSNTGHTHSWSEITSKPTTFTPPIATSSVLGGVKQGTGVTIDANGVISATGGASGNPNVVYVEDFTGASVSAKIQAAIDYAAANAKKTVILADKDYYISSTVTVKVGVRLQGGFGSSVTIGADVRGFVIERNASLCDLKINVDIAGYSKEVIYLDGIQKFYNTWNRARLQNLILLNWTGTVSGTAIQCYSGGVSHEVSFVNFDDIKIVSFSKGIHLKAVQPASDMAWVNANRFNNISLEDCIDMIVIEGSETIPYECSGNMFTNLQIQPTSNTLRIITVQGQYNRFDGMCWDLQSITSTTSALVTFKAESNYNELDMKSIPSTRISNLGKTSNKYATY